MTPLAGAYLAGIRSARDPMHRLTPRDAWFFFDRTVSRMLERWRWIWLAAYLLALPMPALLTLIDPDFRRAGVTAGICVMYADIGLSTGLLVYSSLLLLAPRINQRGWLMAACLAMSLLVLSPILFAASLVFYRTFSNTNTHALIVFAWGFVFFPLQVLMLALALRYWARARGAHWFRMNE